MIINHNDIVLLFVCIRHMPINTCIYLRDIHVYLFWCTCPSPKRCNGEMNCNTHCQYWLLGRLSGAPVFVGNNIRSSDIYFYVCLSIEYCSFKSFFLYTLLVTYVCVISWRYMIDTYLLLYTKLTIYPVVSLLFPANMAYLACMSIRYHG